MKSLAASFEDVAHTLSLKLEPDFKLANSAFSFRIEFNSKIQAFTENCLWIF